MDTNNGTETNHTHLQVKIPLLSINSALTFKSCIINDLKVFPKIKYFESSDLNSIYITFIFFGVENANDIETIMDSYVNEHTRIKYGMLIFHPYKRFPSSVRINKKGKKVVTKEQKKILAL